MPTGTIMSTACDTWTSWTTTSTVTTSSNIWVYWCEGTNTATTTTYDVWTSWQSQTHTSFYGSGIVRTAEEIAADEARTLRWRAQEAELRKQREVAQKRAEQLLVENLSLAQQAQFYKERSFVVEGKNGFRYRIREGRSGNVDMVRPDGTIQHRLCIHPQEFVPDCDTMLAQKILIEVDEDVFLKTANRHHVLTPQQRVLEPLH